MFKNLSLTGLGVSPRQNEMIELALTYKFKGIEIDMDDMAARAATISREFATQFVNSANIKVGVFQLPIDFAADDNEFASSASRLDLIVQLATDIGASRCYYPVQPASDRLGFQENFEQHCSRIAEVAEKLHSNSIQLGLGLLAAPSLRRGKEHQFIIKAEDLLALIKSVNQPNVGLALDTWNWVLGGGAMEQLREIPTASIIEVRLADIPPGADRKTISPGERAAPGEQGITQPLLKLLHTSGYKGPVSVVAKVVQSERIRSDMIAERLSAILDAQLAAAGVVKVPKPPAEEPAEAVASQ